MRVLITNDDGIYSEGIDMLVKKLNDSKNDIYVVAPDRERSACGQAITLHQPLRTTKIQKWKGVKAWSVDGTPTDCTKLALAELIKKSS